VLTNYISLIVKPAIALVVNYARICSCYQPVLCNHGNNMGLFWSLNWSLMD